MNDEYNNVLIAYHANCIDGFTSAWVTHRYFTKIGGCEIDLLPMEYDQLSYVSLIKKLKEKECTELYIVDFSLPLDVMYNIEKKFPNLIRHILDHHKTAAEKYTFNLKNSAVHTATIRGFRIIFNNEKSGAGICWQHFFPTEGVPNLVKYVEDYDLYNFNYERTKPLNLAIREIPKILNSWERLYESLEDSDGQLYLVKKGQEIQKQRWKIIEELKSTAELFCFFGTFGHLVHCPVYDYISEFGSELAESTNSFCLLYIFEPDKGRIKFSVRSVEGSSVTAEEIAKEYGGGGHKHSAGFYLDVGDALYAVKRDNENG